MNPFYQDDAVTIWNSDCREYLAGIGKQRFAAIITSPPYNMRTRVQNGKYDTQKQSETGFSNKYRFFPDDLSIKDYYDFHKAVLEMCLQCSSLVFYNIAIVIGSKEAWFQIIGEFRHVLRDIIVWDKGFGQPAMSENVINRGSELILCFESTGKTGRKFDTAYFDRGTMPDVWKTKVSNQFSTHSLDTGHAAVFPPALPSRILQGWTKKDDTVFDPFGGTGTTARAAKDLGRKCVMCEIVREYCEIAAEKCKQQTFDFQ